MASVKWKWMFGDSITPWRSLFPIICSFFLFSQSPSLSCFHSGSVNIIILFVSPVFHWLLTMLCVCVCAVWHTNTYTHWMLTLSFHTLLIHLLLCLDWLAFRARVIIATRFSLHSSSSSCSSHFAVNNVISNAHKFTHNFILARSLHSVRCLFISNENVNHLPFAHLKGFLKAQPHRVFLSSEIFLFGSARHTSP